MFVGPRFSGFTAATQRPERGTRFARIELSPAVGQGGSVRLDRLDDPVELRGPSVDVLNREPYNPVSRGGFVRAAGLGIFETPLPPPRSPLPRQPAPLLPIAEFGGGVAATPHVLEVAGLS